VEIYDTLIRIEIRLYFPAVEELPEWVMDDFVSEALASERVRVDELDGKLLVTFRHMTVREIELRSGKSTAVMLSVKKRK